MMMRKPQLHRFGTTLARRSKISRSTSTLPKSKNWADPESRQYKFWNREDDARSAGKYTFLIEMSPESIQQEARILSLSDPNDPANAALHTSPSLPLGSSLLGIGTTLEELQQHKSPNVLFVSPSCPHSSVVLPQVLDAHADTIKWVHVRSAGIDFVESEEFASICEERQIKVTNAKGQFSSSLAEYALMACSYFAKDLPRLMRQQQNREWAAYDVEEL